MSEPRGLLDYLGRIVRLAEEKGCTWEQAQEHLLHEYREDFDNVIWVDFHHGSRAVH
jgi:hypothetical protein